MNPMKEVLRAKENIPFTQVANSVLADRELSWKAKGLFAYIYSKPQNWDFAAKRMATESTDGVRSTEEGLKELVTAGYLIRRRRQGGGIDYEISWKKERSQTAKTADSEIRNQPISQSAKTADLSNKDSNTNKESNTTAAFAAPKVDSFFQKTKSEKKDEGAPMNLQEFVLMCRGSQYRHIRLVAEYADEKKSSFTTRGQWREFGRRNMRAASRLAPYSDKQISRAMELLEKDTKDKGGFISKWSLETVEKYLDES